MTTTLINCSISVVKIETHIAGAGDDHAHITILTESVSGEEGFHAPAESAMASISPDDATKIIEALTPIAKVAPKLRSVGKDQH
jgi:hypothetical protein